MTLVLPRRHDHRLRSVARALVATLVTTLGIVALPVVSIGASSAPVETDVVQQSVTADESTVAADFDLAGVVLPEDFDRDHVDVKVRNEDGWGKWQAVSLLGQDDGPDPGTEEFMPSRATEPLIVPGSTEIEVRLPKGESAEVVLIDGGSSENEPAQSAAASPSIVSRAGWGADESLRRCTPSRLAGYKAAVVHHTATSNEYSVADAPGIVRSIYRYHTETLKWCDIGYQFLVDRFGTIYEGRAGSLVHAVQGAQSAGFNSQTFGISIIGTFENAVTPNAAVAAADSVIQWQLALDRVDPQGGTRMVSAGNGKFPAGTVVTLPNVMGHRDNGQTACPGDALYAQLTQFRKAPPAEPGPARPVPPPDPDPPSPPAEDQPVDSPPPAPTVVRYGEANRYATSSTVSRQTFMPGVGVAYVASGHDFADALSGAPVAVKLDGPLLLTEPTQVPDAVASELRRLRPQSIVVLGGVGSVDPSVLEQLRAFSGKVSRIGGKNRYETAALISRANFQRTVPVAYVASGYDFPDALAGAPAAGRQDGPMLLTEPGRVPEATLDELRRLQPQRIVVLGAQGTVSDTVARTLGGLTTAPVTRLGGKNRYETSVTVSADVFDPGSPTAYIASGHDFPDALSGAPASAAQGGPLLLTEPTVVPDSVLAELRRLRPGQIVVLGGSGTVSQRVLEQLQSLRWQ